MAQVDKEDSILDCARDSCKHSHYDHIGWRADWDSKTNCRIVGCNCEAFARNDWLIRMSTLDLREGCRPGDPGYLHMLQEMVDRLLKKGVVK